MIELTVLVVGKNESKNLERLYRSVEKITIPKNVIYVDSASEDKSVEISLQHCDSVFELERSKMLNASAGRYVGTLESRSDWILYLDGDMELEDEFIRYLNERGFGEYTDRMAGFIGYYTYVYDDGSIRENAILQPKNNPVPHFGGAVLLRRRVVLEAGNYNPSVFSNEEIDLYVRLQARGYHVFGLDARMVKHHTKKLSITSLLKMHLFPTNKRYYGFGQVVVSQFKSRTFLIFLRKYPYPFLMFSLFVTAFIGVIINPVLVLPLLLFCLYVAAKKRFHYLALYFTDIIRGFFGLFRYRQYEPTYFPVKSAN